MSTQAPAKKKPRPSKLKRKKRGAPKTHLGILVEVAKRNSFSSISIQVRSDKTCVSMRHLNGKIVIVKELSSERGAQLIKHFLLHHCQLTSIPFEPYTIEPTGLTTREGNVIMQGSVLPVFPEGHDLTILIESR